ncbi:MAG: tripartite tricarboxylate transporter substrate-binding protein, partial [Pseudomonadota bacterium]
GGGQQLSDALGGQFELLSTNVGAQQLEYIRSGRFKPLAVGAPARLTELPDVPTLAELGFASANTGSLFGIFASARTPPDVLQRLNAEINRALLAPSLRNRLMAVNNVPTGGSAESFAQQIERESETNQRLLKATPPVPR